MIDRSLRKKTVTQAKATNKKKKNAVDCYFVRHREYKEAVKEALEMKKDGWTVRNWQYETTTMTFVMLLTRPKGYVKPQEVEEETK